MAEITLQQLDPADQKKVTALAASVKSIAAAYGVARQRVSDAAPKVMNLFRELQHKIGGGFTFVVFARLFDPKMPTHADPVDGVPGYKSNTVYTALDYMKRSETSKSNPRGANKGERDSATDALARTLATLLQVLPVSSHAAIWEQVKTEFRFGPKIMAGLKARVGETKPIVVLKAPKAAVKVGDVIHMEPIKRNNAAAAAAAAEDENGGKLAGRGRRVKIAA